MLHSYNSFLNTLGTFNFTFNKMHYLLSEPFSIFSINFPIFYLFPLLFFTSKLFPGCFFFFPIISYMSTTYKAFPFANFTLLWHFFLVKRYRGLLSQKSKGIEYAQQTTLLALSLSWSKFFFHFFFVI